MPDTSPPPTRNGVGPSCVSLPHGPWASCLDFLVQRFTAVPRATWLDRMARGLVLDAAGNAVHASSAYTPHHKLYYYRELPPEPALLAEETVLFQDAHLVVADKPHFMPVTPSGQYLHNSLLVRLKQRLGIETLAPVHRIDRETAGLVLFSIDPSTRGAYHSVFSQQQIHKRYEAIAPWRADLSFPLERSSRIVEDAQFFRQCEAPGDANARTRIELLQHNGHHGHYRLTPATGKKHQLRVHMNALGLPIVGDLFYPDAQPTGADPLTMPLQLVAKELAFTDPVTGAARHFSSARALCSLSELRP